MNALVSSTTRSSEIAAAFKKYGFGNLVGVVESLGGKYGYGECRDRPRRAAKVGTPRCGVTACEIAGGSRVVPE